MCVRPEVGGGWGVCGTVTVSGSRVFGCVCVCVCVCVWNLVCESGGGGG